MPRPIPRSCAIIDQRGHLSSKYKVVKTHNIKVFLRNSAIRIQLELHLSLMVKSIQRKSFKNFLFSHLTLVGTDLALNLSNYCSHIPLSISLITQ